MMTFKMEKKTSFIKWNKGKTSKWRDVCAYLRGTLVIASYGALSCIIAWKMSRIFRLKRCTSDLVAYSSVLVHNGGAYKYLSSSPKRFPKLGVPFQWHGFRAPLGWHLPYSCAIFLQRQSTSKWIFDTFMQYHTIQDQDSRLFSKLWDWPCDLISNYIGQSPT